MKSQKQNGLKFFNGSFKTYTRLPGVDDGDEKRS